MTRWLRFTQGSGAEKVTHVLAAELIMRMEGRVEGVAEARRVAILAFVVDREGCDFGRIYVSPEGLPLGQAATRATTVLDAILTFLAEPTPTSLVLDVDAIVAGLPT